MIFYQLIKFSRARLIRPQAKNSVKIKSWFFNIDWFCPHSPYTTLSSEFSESYDFFYQLISFLWKGRPNPRG
jgi:hypothetical protein